MRYHTRGAIVGLSALLLAGCAGGVEVKTAIAPDATLNGHSFRFLHVAHTQAAAPADNNDPMLENSITSQQVHHDVEEALMQRGYVHQADSADLAVAYYIGARNKLQVTNYDYGYPFWGWRGWRWGAAWGPWPDQQVTEYEQGTVIIDVLDSSGKRLLWRGVGKSEVPDDPSQYAEALNESVKAIMKKFPGRASS